MIELDHLLWAMPDVARGAQFMESLTGVAPEEGGPHPGMGTRNYLSSLGGGVYLELIGPDEAQDVESEFSARFAALSDPQLMFYALRSSDLQGVVDRARSAGVTVEPPVTMSRTPPDGAKLVWDVLFMRDDRWPDRFPFIIDWKDSPHPSKTVSGGCAFKELVVFEPEPAPLADVFQAIGIPVDVRKASRPALQARLDTPRGELTLLGA